MSNINPQYDLSQISDNDEYRRFSSTVIGQILDLCNGKIEFGNMAVQQVKVTFKTANTDFQILHNLNKTGVNYILVNSSVAANIYNGAGVATTKYLYLRSTAIGTFTLLLY